MYLQIKINETKGCHSCESQIVALHPTNLPSTGTKCNYNGQIITSILVVNEGLKVGIYLNEKIIMC